VEASRPPRHDSLMGSSQSRCRLWGAIVVLVLASSACAGDVTEQSSVVLKPVAIVDVSDLDASVQEAAGVLLNSPGIVVEQIEEIDGVVASRLRMDYRPESGDFSSVESVDTLVRSRGLDQDGGVLSTATIVADDSRFEAVAASPDMPRSASNPWHIVYEDLPEADLDTLPTFIDARDVAKGEYNSDLAASDAYHRANTSGDQWILVSPFGAGTATQRWLIGADGALAEYTVAFEGHTSALDGPKGLPTRVQLLFTPSDQSDPIGPPTLGAPLELDD